MLTLTFFYTILANFDTSLAIFLAKYGAWVYLILFLIIFCETGLVLLPFLPGDSLLFIAGSLAAGQGLELQYLLPTLLAAAWIGNNTNYWIGRHMGPKVFRWPNSRLFNRTAFERTHNFYERHGGKTLIISRFLPLARTFAPFVAGVAQMTYRHFLPLDLLGGSVWVLSLTLCGYWFGGLPWVKDNLFLVVIAIVAVSLLPLGVLFLLRLWKRRAQAKGAVSRTVVKNKHHS